MPAILIRGARVIDPAGGLDEISDLLIDDGRIVDRGANLNTNGATVIDANGRVVAPGFVDLHTHLRFPGFPDKETIASGTAAAAAGGFTTVCAMANTKPVVDDVATLREVLNEVARSARVRVRQLASVSTALAGELAVDFPALAAAGAVAFSDDGKPVWNEDLMRVALAASRDLGRAISVHEEDPLIVGQGVANDGKPARRLGLAPWPCRGEADLVERDIRLLSEIGGHLHIAHVSC
ncbi:MAG TPA: amidohydrolase family protein, partial [Chloroflexota bacterium]|nr:amidohydrolase family protein [Chloroflexota bacterium]